MGKSSACDEKGRSGNSSAPTASLPAFRTMFSGILKMKAHVARESVTQRANLPGSTTRDLTLLQSLLQAPTGAHAPCALKPRASSCGAPDARWPRRRPHARATCFMHAPGALSAPLCPHGASWPLSRSWVTHDLDCARSVRRGLQPRRALHREPSSSGVSRSSPPLSRGRAAWHGMASR
jgi:hypothetical protein